MQEVLALSLQSMQQDMQRLDRIGVNLANALTPGFKREVVATQAVDAGAMSFAGVVDRLNARQVSQSGVAPAMFAPSLVRPDLRPGTLKSTGQSLDVALASSGYFEVATETGPAYTRQGNFHVDARGRLVTAQGHPVMGKGGEIFLKSATPVIDAAGNVYDAQPGGSSPADASNTQQAVAQIKIVEFEDKAAAQRIGDGLTSVGSDSVLAMKDADVQLKQGYLENSNVNAMQEMVQMIQTMRHFESVQKIALGYDEMTGQAIRKLGELS